MYTNEKFHVNRKALEQASVQTIYVLKNAKQIYYMAKHQNEKSVQ